MRLQAGGTRPASNWSVATGQEGIMTFPTIGASACVLAAFGLILGSPAQAAAQPSPVRTSASWVPFEAAYRAVRSDGGVETGRFHRDAAGSTRLAIEAGDPSASRATITIVNIPQKVLYLRSKGGVWSAQAVRLSTHSTQPRLLRTDTPGLTHLLEPFEGHDAYRLDAGRGPIDVVVPDLNFFAVRREWRGGPRQVTEFREVRIGEQRADLFTPPPDAAIRRLTEIGAREIDLEVTSGGWHDVVPTREAQPAAVDLPDGRRYLVETRLLDDLRFVVSVKVYLPSQAATGATRTPVEELELESWRPVETTKVEPSLRIHLVRVSGRAFSILEPGIY
jgi:hypothetical protein